MYFCNILNYFWGALSYFDCSLLNVILGWSGTHYGVEINHEFLIVLLPLHKCWVTGVYHLKQCKGSNSVSCQLGYIPILIFFWESGLYGGWFYVNSTQGGVIWNWGNLNLGNASAPVHRFLPCLSFCFTAFDDELLHGTVTEINPFLPKLSLVMVFSSQQ